MSDLEARLREVLNEICLDSLESSLSEVVEWPSGAQVTDLFQRADALLRRLSELEQAIRFLAKFYALPLEPHDPEEWHGGMVENIAKCPVCVVNAVLSEAGGTDE